MPPDWAPVPAKPPLIEDHHHGSVTGNAGAGEVRESAEPDLSAVFKHHAEQTREAGDPAIPDRLMVRALERSSRRAPKAQHVPQSGTIWPKGPKGHRPDIVPPKAARYTAPKARPRRKKKRR